MVLGVVLQHTIEPHAWALRMSAACRSGLCDSDGDMQFDVDIASSREDHYYTFLVGDVCLLNYCFSAYARSCRNMNNAYPGILRSCHTLGWTMSTLA
jgi:hypothetical protein